MSHSINIAQDLLSPSLFVQLILWIEERDSDQKVLLAERIIPTGMMGRYQVTLFSNTPHCAPLERGNLDMSHSINIAQDLLSPSLFVQLILWIEERDSDQKVLLAE